MKEKTPMSHEGVLSDAWFHFFLENYITSEGDDSQNVLYYQPLPITSYQVRFYANNSFE